MVWYAFIRKQTTQTTKGHTMWGDDTGSRTEADAGAFERGRADYGDDLPTASDLAADAYYDGPVTLTEGGVRCGSCRGRHATPKDVRWCYDLTREQRAEYEAEAAAEAASEVAFARDREAMAERGTWFGPQTEADTWG
jgi:hypothetical protein